MITLKNIVVATDFGDAAQAAVAHAADLAETFGAMLHVVHVAGPSGSGGAREQLERSTAGLAPRTQTSVITSAFPGPAIIDYATRTQADLLLAGTHGRNGFADWFMGSVAQQLVRSAPCPVMTMRAKPEGR